MLTQTDESPHDQLEYGENIEAAPFEQILEMDEDDPSRDFSRGIVFGFFEQAESTFQKMDDALCVAPPTQYYRPALL